MLNPLNLGNFKSRETAKQNRCYPRVAVSQRVCPEQGIYIKINYTNADHVHPIVDLPTALSIEKLIQLLKESSSHWINSNNLSTGKFAWGRGYGAFSVSESDIEQVAAYIARQEEHHRARTFADELREFIESPWTTLER
jgi:REP element-mobilizing transposase RayT